MRPTTVIAAAGAAVALAATVASWTMRSSDDGTEGPATTATVLDGAALFKAKGCATCHTGPDSTALFAEFPNLADAASWAGERRDGMSADEYVFESIRDPQAFISPVWSGTSGPTDGMPGLPVTEEEADALVRYLLDATD